MMTRNGGIAVLISVLILGGSVGYAQDVGEVAELARGIVCLFDAKLCDATSSIDNAVAAVTGIMGSADGGSQPSVAAGPVVQAEQVLTASVTTFNRQMVFPPGQIRITFRPDQVAHLWFWTGQQQYLGYFAVQQAPGVWVATFHDNWGQTIGRIDMRFFNGVQGVYRLASLTGPVWEGEFYFR